MLPFRKVLCPVDYSEPCKAIIPYVKDIVDHFSSELVLVHSYGPSAIAALGYGDRSMTNPDLCEEVRAREAEKLKAFALEMFPDQHVESVVDLGEPGCIVHKIARHYGTDLVMLATRGHGPMRRLLLGSVTAKVLHDMSTPVWTGAGSTLAEHSSRIPYESILCALDHSEEAEVILKAARTLADSYQAGLSVLHVIEMPAAFAEIDSDGLRRQLLDAAHSWLRELMNKQGVDCPGAVRCSILPDAVREEVVRTHADLVVTGRGHAQAAFSRTFSKLFPIVRESPCPVLSI